MTSSRRNRRVHVKSIAFADYAPYVDFLFSILTIFLIATPIMLGGVNIDLPKGQAEIIVVKKEPLVVTVKKDGSIYIDKDLIKLSTLAGKLSELTLGEKKIKIFVRADKDIAYDRVITVVGAIYNAGFFDVTLVTDMRKV
jgi:biopolymer transport protein TolR